MSMDFQGDLSEQDFDVLVDVERRELVVTVNGQVYIRLELPPSKWLNLRAGATAVLTPDLA